jgi:hypothetical protein
VVVGGVLAVVAVIAIASSDGGGVGMYVDHMCTFFPQLLFYHYSLRELIDVNRVCIVSHITWLKPIKQAQSDNIMETWRACMHVYVCVCVCVCVCECESVCTSGVIG